MTGKKDEKLIHDNLVKNDVIISPRKTKQLELFEESFLSLPNSSATIELWDAAPRFKFGGSKREMGKYLDNLTRSFQVRGKSYEINIAPAAITDKNGDTKQYYAGQREELVEDVIKKILIQKREGFSKQEEKEIGVSFTLYEVWKELKRMGHAYDLNEIKLAINICNRISYKITSKDNDISWTSSIFPSVGMQEKAEGGKNLTVVTLSPLVVDSINKGTYRAINYEIVMLYKMPLSRWLHKKISHYYSQLGIRNPYIVKQSTIVRDSGMTEYAKKSQILKQITKCLDELKKFETLKSYEIEKFDGQGRVIPVEEKGKKIEDVKFILHATDEFISDVTKANAAKNLRFISENKTSISNDEIKEELVKNIYGLSGTVIENLLFKIKTAEDQSNILQALLAAREYIEKKSECNAAAITKSAIKENWKPRGPKKDQGQKETVNKDDAITYIPPTPEQKKIWKILHKNLERNFEEEIFNKWLSKLSLYSLTDKEIVISVPSKFLRDWIKREYLEQKELNKMGIKELLLKEMPELENISIIYSEINSFNQ